MPISHLVPAVTPAAHHSPCGQITPDLESVGAGSVDLA